MAAEVPAPKQWIQVDALTVQVYDRHESMAVAAAHAAASLIQEALAARGRAFVVFASAASQVRFLAALAEETRVDWSRVVAFHMDEYLGIAEDHPASFRRFLRERVEVPLRPKLFHYLRGEADEPLKECERYAGLLRAQPVDVCCLGIGENGHLAFNDPHVAEFHDPRLVKIVRLDEACRRQQVGEGAFPDFASVPQFAYTLTIPALTGARKLVCVVPEKRKAEAVRRALRGLISPSCPASILRRAAHATIYLDGDSASLLA
jgi:glucosamine-6-phosphate deaminase